MTIVRANVSFTFSFICLGQEGLVELLLQFGANVDSRNDEDRTPLHFASSHGEEKIAEILIQYGADINAASALNSTPIHFAAQFGKYTIRPENEL